MGIIQYLTGNRGEIQPSENTAGDSGNSNPHGAVDAEYRVVDTTESDRLKAERREQFKIDRATEKARRELETEKSESAQKAEDDAKVEEEYKRAIDNTNKRNEGRWKTEKEEKAERERKDKEDQRKSEKIEQDRLRRENQMEMLKEKNRHDLEMKRAQTPKQTSRMSKGQFKAGSAKSTKYIDPFPGGGTSRGFPNVDPLGGMGGSGRNMMNFGLGTGFAKPAPKQQQQQQKPQPPRPQRKPVDINAAFGNPFAGIINASPQRAVRGTTPNILKGMDRAPKGKGQPGNKLLGLPSAQKTAKKLKRMDDWMNF